MKYAMLFLFYILYTMTGCSIHTPQDDLKPNVHIADWCLNGRSFIYNKFEDKCYKNDADGIIEVDCTNDVYQYIISCQPVKVES